MDTQVYLAATVATIALQGLQVCLDVTCEEDCRRQQQEVMLCCRCVLFIPSQVVCLIKLVRTISVNVLAFTKSIYFCMWSRG